MPNDGSDRQPADPLRVCIVAESASFRFGGEASLPLHYFSRLRARGVEAWLILHSRTRPELQALLPLETDRIRYQEDRWYHILFWRLGSALPRRASQATIGTLLILINQFIQSRMVRDLIRDQGVNLVHQPVPVSPKSPSFFYGFGVPVVIGPMNGGMDYPAAFHGSESLLTRITVALARSSTNLVNALIPGKRKAALLLVANERTRLALPSVAPNRVMELPENGVDLSIWTMPADPPSLTVGKAPARFLFVGRLVDWKRLDFALHALASLPGAHLEVIGDGPMRPAWTALAEQLGIAGRVHWVGFLPQPECAQRLHGSTALLLPSIYECGGAVVLEAMACGIPVIATHWGGPADYLDASCGILVDPSNAETITGGFQLGMQRLLEDPPFAARLGAAGRKRVEEHFDWDRKIDRILEIYEQARRNSPR